MVWFGGMSPDSISSSSAAAAAAPPKMETKTARAETSAGGFGGPRSSGRGAGRERVLFPGLGFSSSESLSPSPGGAARKSVYGE